MRPKFLIFFIILFTPLHNQASFDLDIDDNGNFSLNVEIEDAILNFSHIAYESKIIKSADIVKDENPIVLEMKETFLELDEVVAVRN